MNALRSFFRAPLPVKSLAVEVAVVLWATRLALWFLPFQWIHRLILQHNRPGSTANPMSADLQAVVRMLKRMSYHVPDATCLTRAIAGQILLARREIATTLYIGVAKPTNEDSKKLLAHAWLECNSVVILGETADLQSYVPLPILSSYRL